MKRNIVNQSLLVAAVAIFSGLGLVAPALANQNEADQPKKKVHRTLPGNAAFILRKK
jgi:hypothetical protein